MAKIIREKDAGLKELEKEMIDLQNENRNIYNEINGMKEDNAK